MIGVNFTAIFFSLTAESSLSKRMYITGACKMTVINACRQLDRKEVNGRVYRLVETFTSDKEKERLWFEIQLWSKIKSGWCIIRPHFESFNNALKQFNQES